MLIGNLAETMTAEDSDYIILSKDNVHLLKIKKEQLMKGFSKENTSKLKYWTETSRDFYNEWVNIPEDERQIATDNGDGTFTWMNHIFPNEAEESAVFADTNSEYVDRRSNVPGSYYANSKNPHNIDWEIPSSLTQIGTFLYKNGGISSSYSCFISRTGKPDLIFIITPLYYTNDDAETLTVDGSLKFTGQYDPATGELIEGTMRSYARTVNDGVCTYKITYNHIVYSVVLFIYYPHAAIPIAPIEWKDNTFSLINLPDTPLPTTREYPTFIGLNGSALSEWDPVIREIIGTIGFSYIRPIVAKRMIAGIGNGEKKIWFGKYVDGQPVYYAWMDADYNMHANGYYIGDDTPVGGSSIKYPAMSVNEWAAFKTPNNKQVYGKTVSVQLFSTINTLANISGAHYVGCDSKFSFIEKTTSDGTTIYNFPTVTYANNAINYAQIRENGDTGLFEIENSEFFINATATVTIYYTKS